MIGTRQQITVLYDTSANKNGPSVNETFRVKGASLLKHEGDWPLAAPKDI